MHFSGRSEPARGPRPEGERSLLGSRPTVALQAEAIPPHIATRVWSLNSQDAREHLHLFVLPSGKATILRDFGEEITVSGPAAGLLPPGSCARLEIGAGAVAGLLKLKAALWHRYVLPSTEEVSLDLARLREPLVLAVETDLALALARSIAALSEELMAPAHRGALSIISAELSLFLLRLWRRYGSEEEHVHGNSAAVLRRFRRLVEQHFQHHLRVADFASQLGISTDRLHAICTRTLGRTPSELIQQRLVQEAVLRLETSSAPVKQIAFALGFKDTAYFSRFFVKHTGVSPRSWRLTVTGHAEVQRAAAPALQFADWP